METQNQELATMLAEMVAEAVAPLYQAVAELKPQADPRDGEVNLTETKKFYQKKGVYGNEK